MLKKQPSKNLLVTAVFILVMSMTYPICLSFFSYDHQSGFTQSSEYYSFSKRIVLSTPKHITIPKINTEADVYSVGINKKGEMDISDNADQVAWYKYGPYPGENGSAVIAGHYGWDVNGKASIFTNINQLAKGDEIIVLDEKDNQIIFVVREIKKYNPDSDASEIFLSSDNKSHLNLITCNGSWLESEQTYSNRLVVFTDKK